ncbi:LysR family transcriptional regulator [Alteromonas flava]|uniref:LysR family transcriptional regulator n=1 Tax=Alteromonas flava TaxID=2048003 RepID=UPI0013DD8507|nr:LysR family transcriptional regulator [Alteromonas flava]
MNVDTDSTNDLICIVLDTRFLSTFIEVCNTRHFGRAAENLFITQAAVSARIRSLEEYYKVELVERTRNHIKPTLAGERLLPYAKHVVELLAQSRSSVAEISPETFAIGVNELVAELLSEQLGTYVQQRIPQQVISINTETADVISRQLHERLLNIGILTEPLKSDDIESVCVLEVPLALFNSEAESGELNACVQVNYPSKLLDALQIEFVQCRHSLFKTNSLRLAGSLAYKQNCAVVLPMTTSVAQWGFEPKQHQVSTATLKVYACYLKQAQQTHIQDVIKVIQMPE